MEIMEVALKRCSRVVRCAVRWIREHRDKLEVRGTVRCGGAWLTRACAPQPMARQELVNAREAHMKQQLELARDMAQVRSASALRGSATPTLLRAFCPRVARISTSATACCGRPCWTRA